MTRQETLAIMGVLKAAYPSYYKGMNRKDAESVVDLWATMFSDEQAELVAMAVKAHIASDTKGYPPHIGAIKEAIGKLLQPEQITEMEAWALIDKATRNAKYTAQEEFDKLPPVLQRLVGTPTQLQEWGMMDAETVQSVVASNFKRSYKAISQKQKERLALPSDIRQRMLQLSDNMTIPQITSGE